MTRILIDRIGDVKTLIADNYVKRLDKPAYLLGVYYDGDLGKAVLEFIDDSGEKLLL